MVVGVSRAVIFQNVRALLVFPKFEQILCEKKHGFEFWLSGLKLEVVLFLVVGIAVDEAFGQKAFLDIVISRYSHQQLSRP